MTLILKAIPETLNEAVNRLLVELTDWERDHVLRMARPRACDGLGTLGRSEWCLWERDSPIVQNCVEQFGLAHSQDLSSLLMEALWARVHGEAPLTRSLAACLRNRWRSQGFDPVTMRPLPHDQEGRPPVILHRHSEEPTPVPPPLGLPLR